MFQDLGKMFQVLQEVSRSYISYQGVPNFSSLGQLILVRKLELHEFEVKTEVYLEFQSRSSSSIQNPNNNSSVHTIV